MFARRFKLNANLQTKTVDGIKMNGLSFKVIKTIKV